jgi:hypothetical protein
MFEPQGGTPGLPQVDAVTWSTTTSQRADPRAACRPAPTLAARRSRPARRRACRGRRCSSPSRAAVLESLAADRARVDNCSRRCSIHWPRERRRRRTRWTRRPTTRLAIHHRADPQVQPRAPGRDHQRTHGDHRRRRGPQGLSASSTSELIALRFSSLFSPPPLFPRDFTEPMSNLPLPLLGKPRPSFGASSARPGGASNASLGQPRSQRRRPDVRPPSGVGKVTQVIGPVVDVEFPGACPRSCPRSS